MNRIQKVVKKDFYAYVFVINGFQVGLLTLNTVALATHTKTKRRK